MASSDPAGRDVSDRDASDVDHRKVAHLIAGELRRRIVRGEIAAETTLPSEVDLTVMFSASRETVREALAVLASESLIRVKRGRGGGAMARRPDLDAAARYASLLLQVAKVTSAQLHEAKGLIERPAAAIVAHRRVGGSVDVLAAAHDRELAGLTEPAKFLEALGQFDRSVVELSGNRSLATFAGVLSELFAAQLQALSNTSGFGAFARKVNRCHGEFLDAVRRGDGVAGSEVWSSYTNDILATIADAERRIDVVPLWRDQSERRGSGAPARMATNIVMTIRSQLAQGELTQGDSLASVPDLAAAFDVSRPTMREALRVLEAERLVLLRPGARSGPVVRDPSVSVAATLAGIVLESNGATFADLLEARTLVEPEIMGRSAERIDASRVALLREICDDVALSTEQSPASVRRSMEFRFAALTAAANPALLLVLEIIRRQAAGSLDAFAATAADMPWDDSVHRRVHGVYVAVTDALEVGDAVRAASLWRRHLKTTSPFFRSRLGDRLIVDLVDY